MKKTMLITALAACVLHVNAQQMQASAGTDQAAPVNMTASSAASPMDVFGTTTMDIDKDVIRFSNMPANCTVKAYITDADGQMVSHCKLTAEKNTIDISKMSSGLYFVTLFDKSKRKSFKVVR